MTDKKRGNPSFIRLRLPPKSNNRVAALILYLSVDFNQINKLGKAYRWARPRCCPSCKGYRLWGHGYANRYFDGVSIPLPMKRWRCPDCGAVHTMRPHTHWRGFWACESVILKSLERKESVGRWLSELGRERQQYWWRGYLIQQRFEGRLKTLLELVSDHVMAATHSLTHREITPYEHEPHLIFAFTSSVRGP